MPLDLTPAGRVPMLVREVRAWRSFVEALQHAPTNLSAAHVAAVLKHWDALADQLHALPPPLTAPKDAEYVYMVWDSGTKIFDLEVYTDGSIQWFFRDRMRREIDGTEDPVAQIPVAAVERLRSVLRNYKRPKG